MLQSMPRHSVMNAHLGVPVAGNPLPFLVGPVAVLAEHRAALRILAHGRAVIADLHRVRIVQRHRPGGRLRTVYGVAQGHRILLGGNWWMFGRMKSATRTQTLSS